MLNLIFKLGFNIFVRLFPEVEKYKNFWSSKFELQEIYEKYGSTGLEILAFPSNQFGEQEPDSDEVIKEKIVDMFGVTFDLYSKIEVNGPGAIPLYDWLKSSEVNQGVEIAWNFESFLIDKCGSVVGKHLSDEEPIFWEDEVRNLVEDEPECV